MNPSIYGIFCVVSLTFFLQIFEIWAVPLFYAAPAFVQQKKSPIPRDQTLLSRHHIVACYNTLLLYARLLVGLNYLMMVATEPAPTVRPPSRMENLVPSSIAIGLIRLTVTVMLSPGITISEPSGRLITPVTSVVRK